MPIIAASDVFVFDAYRLVVVRTSARVAHSRKRTLRVERMLTICGGGRTIEATVVGTGSHRGQATLLIRPCDDFDEAIDVLVEILAATHIELRHDSPPSEAWSPTSSPS
jgi:hypothetical protein